MEESVQLIGGYGDLAAEGEGKCVIAAKSSAAAAAINNGDNSGEGEADYHHDDGDDSDYLPRKFKKYRSIAEIYQSTEPSEIVNTTAKRRQGKNNIKKLAKRIMKKKAANDGELTGNSNFIEVESLEEAADMEACPTRNPKFRSMLELYEVTQQPATVSVMHMN